MNVGNVKRGVLTGTVLLLLSAAALAQTGPGGAGRPGRMAGRNNPQMQECRKQAQAKNLGRAERRTFMQQCMKSAAGAGKGSKSGNTGPAT